MGTEIINKVLAIGHVWPEPGASAAGWRMISLLRAFRLAGWNVEFACAAQAGDRPVALREMEVRTRDIELNATSFDDYVSSYDPQLVMFDRFVSEEQYGWRVTEHCPGALQVLDTEDLHSLRVARQTHAGTADSSRIAPTDVRSCHDLMNGKALTYRELASILRCDLSLIISSFEMRLLREAFAVPAAKLQYTPFLLPVETTSCPDFPQRRDFIFVGNFRHPPNRDAFEWILGTIWPLILDRLGDARLDVYGAYADSRIRAAHDPRRGIHVHGRAMDIDSVMRQARVCLAPLRFGAGLKGKLIDAMRNGTPSVTTAIGAEGIGDAEAWPGAVTDRPDSLAEAAVALHESPVRWRAAVANVPACLEQFDFGAGADTLIGRIEDACRCLQPLRKADFLGSMLRHHSLQSSRYLAKWIEEKARNRE